jgi:hypothetical protein
MRTMIKAALAAATLATASLGAIQPAQARDDTGIAVAAGVIGLGLGAAIASDSGGYTNVGYYDRGYYGGGYSPAYGYGGGYRQPAYGYGYDRGYRGRGWERGYRDRGYRDHGRHHRDGWRGRDRYDSRRWR